MSEMLGVPSGPKVCRVVCEDGMMVTNPIDFDRGCKVYFGRASLWCGGWAARLGRNGDGMMIGMTTMMMIDLVAMMTVYVCQCIHQM